MTRSINLDSINGVKPISSAMFRAISYLEERYGELSAPYNNEQVLDAKQCFKSLYELFGARADDQFVLTSSGAEAVSQIMHSVLHVVVRGQGKNHFVVRKIDEAPAILAASSLDDEACTLSFAEIGIDGFMTLDALIDAINPRTALLSLSLACALTGVLQPVEDIIRFAKSRSILVHIDATHCIGKIPIHFQELGCDYLSFNAEQFHAPKGSGGFFATKEAPLRPLIYGSGLNLAQLNALTEASNEAKNNEMLYCTEVCRLRKKLEDACKEIGAEVLFEKSHRLPHISCMSFEGIKNEALLFALSRKGVFASMGGGMFQSIQNVLQACHKDMQKSQCALTFSLSLDTQESEIDRAIVIIKECVERLRKISRAVL